MDGTGELKADKLIESTSDITVAALPGGMESGMPSVAIWFKLPDGTTVFAQTSMVLFQTAAKAFAGRYGWVSDDPRNPANQPIM